MAEGRIRHLALNYINQNNVTVNNVPPATSTDLTTIRLPGTGIWIVISYVSLSKGGNTAYNHILGGRTIRSTEGGGGGSINVLAVAGNTDIPLKVYHNITGGCNVHYGYQAFKIK